MGLTAPEQGPAPLVATPPVSRRWLAQEVWLVFGVSLGFSGIYAVLDLALAAVKTNLSSQPATLNGSAAPGHPNFDLAYQLVGLTRALVPVLLGLYFLQRTGEGPRTIGLDGRRKGQDLARGALLAAVVGGTGLAFYLVTYALGVDLAVVAEDLPAVWWRYPVLLLEALHDGLLEEVLVVGYLLHRLKQLGWSDNRSLVASAVLRGSYHLYQGVGGAVGNLVMGLLFGRLYQRYGRVMPLVIAHTLIDAVAFCGYAALVGKVSWLPVV